MSNWMQACQASDLIENEGKCVVLGQRQIALFKLGDDYFAMDNICPHAGAPLANGAVEDGIVICPWHGWEFNIKDGKSPEIPNADLQTFAVKIEDGKVYVDVSE